MKSRYPIRPLGDVLTLDLDAVPIEPMVTYHTAGILSYGRGLFARPAITGAETSYKQYFRLHRDQVVFSRLFAWEGAAALVASEFDGYFVSSEFPTFKVDVAEAVPSYLGHLMRWSEFHELLAGATRGLGLRRQRVHVDEFLAIKVPLPDLEEQHRVAQYLSWGSRRAMDLARRVSMAQSIVGNVVAASRAALARTGPERSLVEVADIVMGQSPPGHSYNAAVDGVPLLNGPTEFGPSSPQPVQWTSSPTKLSQPGDLLISVRASIGRTNWADGVYCIGRGLAALRPLPAVMPPFLRHAVLAQLAELRARTSGSTFQNLASGRLGSLPVAVPPLETQRAIAQRLDAIEEHVRDLQDRNKRADTLTTAWDQSLLNYGFGGLT